MNRRNFFRSMVGGVAAAAAVRTWPFRVYSFPTEVKTFWWKPEDIIGQSIYRTTAASANYFHVGDILYLHPDQVAVAKEIMGWDGEGKKHQFRVTEVEETTLTLKSIPPNSTWQGLVRRSIPRHPQWPGRLSSP